MKTIVRASLRLNKFLTKSFFPGFATSLLLVVFSGVSGAYTVDLNPDFICMSKGRLTSSGYEIEIRIPFKSLRYQSRDPQRGFNIIRMVQGTGHLQTWTRVLQARPSFLAQLGTLTFSTLAGGAADYRTLPQATTC